jgi:cyclomaltodextrinase / maltogenic alpha-amylase / neopullulanase
MKFAFLPALIAVLSFFSCNNDKNTPKTANTDAYSPKPYIEIKHPEWTKSATIYEVNIRQYTPEGTFKAFETHLPRLKAMGIDIIWLMPIHPIGVEKRKGGKGSYYSVKDFYGINPEFGTDADFKALVAKIHSMGMHVIIDWVGNHSAWDNPLTKQHPDWYTKDPAGNFQPTTWYDWDDVIDFDYENPALRKYMTDALKHWVKNYDIDGYRCDVAGFIPVDYWENTRAELDAIKPVFMLAEWESRDLFRRSFDATYSWTLWDKLRNATTGKKGAGALIEYMAHDVNSLPADAIRMTFTDNHDKNSWEGTQYKNFGAGLETSMVFCTLVNGMPLVYGGQEAGLDKSLAFFEKDEIKWQKHPFADLYTQLFALKHANKALWNGANGGVMIRIYNDKQNEIVSFSRTKDGNKVIAIFNFSDKPSTVKLNTQYNKGIYTDYFTQKPTELKGDDVMTLPKWGYVVLVGK